MFYDKPLLIFISIIKFGYVRKENEIVNAYSIDLDIIIKKEVMVFSGSLHLILLTATI